MMQATKKGINNKIAESSQSSEVKGKKETTSTGRRLNSEGERESKRKVKHTLERDRCGGRDRWRDDWR